MLNPADHHIVLFRIVKSQSLILIFIRCYCCLFLPQIRSNSKSTQPNCLVNSWADQDVDKDYKKENEKEWDKMELQKKRVIWYHSFPENLISSREEKHWLSSKAISVHNSHTTILNRFWNLILSYTSCPKLIWNRKFVGVRILKENYNVYSGTRLCRHFFTVNYDYWHDTRNGPVIGNISLQSIWEVCTQVVFRDVGDALVRCHWDVCDMSIRHCIDVNAMFTICWQYINNNKAWDIMYCIGEWFQFYYTIA